MDNSIILHHSPYWSVAVHHPKVQRGKKPKKYQESSLYNKNKGKTQKGWNSLRSTIEENQQLGRRKKIAVVPWVTAIYSTLQMSHI